MHASSHLRIRKSVLVHCFILSFVDRMKPIKGQQAYEKLLLLITPCPIHSPYKWSARCARATPRWRFDVGIRPGALGLQDSPWRGNASLDCIT